MRRHRCKTWAASVVLALSCACTLAPAASAHPPPAPAQPLPSLGSGPLVGPGHVSDGSAVITGIIDDTAKWFCRVMKRC